MTSERLRSHRFWRNVARVLLLLGLALFILTQWPYRFAYLSYGWKETTGAILAVDFNVKAQSTIRAIHYSYVAPGPTATATYSETLVQFGPQPMSAHTYMERLPSNRSLAAIPVYYNPSRPAQATLVRGVSPDGLRRELILPGLLFGAGAVLLVATALWQFCVWLRTRGKAGA
ncbi:MAG: hypothetical protein B9S32_17830 [Verrucomicrobia bacterium Tous-C9LFEB]|nr:MAG: hypothetical protein B9S32_17830 [Verrucomicrobia bacterium Tous-C9LFEB]